MTNLQIMMNHLNNTVISSLHEQGFVGKHPHLKREKENCIELITFQRNKHGGSFAVEVSAIFPGRKNPNYVLADGVSLDGINVWHTDERYRLKGMYDGWFYYRDLYSKYILGFGKDYLEVAETVQNVSIPKGYKLVQRFNDNTADKICNEISKQLTKAFCWLNKFEKNNILQELNRE